MLLGRSTVVAAWDFWNVENVLYECRKRLGLSDDGGAMELWHSSGERVPDDDTQVCNFPGVQPKGEISEYQLLVTMTDLCLCVQIHMKRCCANSSEDASESARFKDLGVWEWLCKLLLKLERKRFAC
eukprot:2246887-Amphidinium_carterae.1